MGRVNSPKTHSSRSIDHWHYEEIPDPKMRVPIKTVPYTVVGRFTDGACKSFTGKWTEGVDIVSVYEINIDID